MKKSIIAATIGAIFASSAAHAQSWFSANANITVNTAYSRAVVQNSFPNPIYCQGYVYGRTYSGFQANSWMDTMIPAGGYGEIYVYANNPNMDPIVDGWADIRCRF